MLHSQPELRTPDGWQLQKDKRTVQGELEEAITKFKKAVGEDIANSYLEKRNKHRGKYLPTQTFEFKKPIFAGEGKGKHQLYDLAIPSFMKKYGKKWNARVYDDTIEELGIMEYAEDFKMPVTILELTPEMKKAVQEGSQSLFEILGTLGASGVAAKSLSDSQGNNTISN